MHKYGVYARFLSGNLVGVVRERMQPGHVSVWLRPEKAQNGSSQSSRPILHKVGVGRLNELRHNGI